MKQTAVQWLVNEMIQRNFFATDASLSWTTLEHLTNQALEMEKEQIENAYNISWTLRDKPYATANKYYKETYEAQEN